MGLVTVALAWFHYRASAEPTRRHAEAGDVPLRNPFSLTAAVKFAILFAAVLLLVKVVQLHFPGGGVYVVAALAGLTDVDAITLSMAEFAEPTTRHQAATAVVIAALSNTLVKAGMVGQPGRQGAAAADPGRDRVPSCWPGSAPSHWSGVGLEVRIVVVGRRLQADQPVHQDRAHATGATSSWRTSRAPRAPSSQGTSPI